MAGSFLRARFRGKSARLVAITKCFQDHPGTGLHPKQVANATGIGFIVVHKMLSDTPELFVPLVKKADGLTRFRLSSAFSAKSPQEIEDFIARSARSESLTLYATIAIVTSLLAIVIVLGFPWNVWT